MKELYGKTSKLHQLYFRDADILIQNPLSVEKMQSDMKLWIRLIETEHYFLLFTKEWQITIIANEFGKKDRFLNIGRKMPTKKVWKEIIQNICKMRKYRNRI